MANALKEPFVPRLTEFEIAQIRSKTAGNSSQAMTAGAILIVTGGTNFNSFCIADIWIFGKPFPFLEGV